MTFTSCTLTCRRPPAVAVGTASPVTTAVSVSDELEFFNALSLASVVQNSNDGSTSGLYGSGPVMIVVRQDLVLGSPLWPAVGVALQRTVTVVGAAAAVPLSAVVGSGGGNATSVGRRVRIDLQVRGPRRRGRDGRGTGGSCRGQSGRGRGFKLLLRRMLRPWGGWTAVANKRQPQLAHACVP